jgi:hypothetical protein
MEHLRVYIDKQFRAYTQLEILLLVSRRHGRSNERPLPPRCQVRALPRAAWNHKLHLLPGKDILPQRHPFTLPGGVQQQHLHRVAEVKVIHLVRCQAVQR